MWSPTKQTSASYDQAYYQLLPSFVSENMFELNRYIISLASLQRSPLTLTKKEGASGEAPRPQGFSEFHSRGFQIVRRNQYNQPCLENLWHFLILLHPSSISIFCHQKSKAIANVTNYSQKQTELDRRRQTETTAVYSAHSIAVAGSFHILDKA